jgi:hypothetical protein
LKGAAIMNGFVAGSNALRGTGWRTNAAAHDRALQADTFGPSLSYLASLNGFEWLADGRKSVKNHGSFSVAVGSGTSRY